MKKSNIVLALAVLVFLATLFAFNSRLKADYLQAIRLGPNKYLAANKFAGYEKLNLPSFDRLKTHGDLSIAVEYGDSTAVWIRNEAKDMINISSENSWLSIGMSELGKQENHHYWDKAIIIIVPKINEISMLDYPRTRYTEKGNTKTTTTWRQEHQLQISGFKQDSLHIKSGSVASIHLENNSLKKLTAGVGSAAAAAKLVLAPSNSIHSLHLHAKGESHVELKADIPNFVADVSDSTTISVSGKALQKLLK